MINEMERQKSQQRTEHLLKHAKMAVFQTFTHQQLFLVLKYTPYSTQCQTGCTATGPQWGRSRDGSVQPVCAMGTAILIANTQLLAITVLVVYVELACNWMWQLKKTVGCLYLLQKPFLVSLLHAKLDLHGRMDVQHEIDLLQSWVCDHFLHPWLHPSPSPPLPSPPTPAVQ